MDNKTRFSPPLCRARALAAALAVLGTLVTVPCRAADWKTHYDLALALYQAQKFEDSIPEVKAAYEQMPNPGLLFNLAQAYRKAGHPREAIEYYDRYLSAAPQLNEEMRHKVDSYLAETRNTLAALELEMKRRLAEEKAAHEHEPEPAAPRSPPPSPPPPPPATAAELAVLTAPAAPPTRPLYKRWWLWTAVAGAAVTAAVITGGVVASQSPATPVAVPAGVPRATIIF